MSINDQRSIVKIQSVNVTQINEALRTLNVAITKLEGRQGQIILRDGIHSSTSTSGAVVLDSGIASSASCGIYFAGVNGQDTWIVSGARLSPAAEWIALDTRAAMLRLSFSSGPQFYFNTGLTINASFIPSLVSFGTSSIVWGSYDSTTVGSPIDFDTVIHEDGAYFSQAGGGTQVQLLTDGVHQIQVSGALETGGGGGISRLNLLLNGALIRSSKIDTATPDSLNDHTIYHIASFTSGDLLSVTYDIGGPLYVAESTGLNRIYVTKLIP